MKRKVRKINILLLMSVLAALLLSAASVQGARFKEGEEVSYMGKVVGRYDKNGYVVNDQGHYIMVPKSGNEIGGRYLSQLLNNDNPKTIVFLPGSDLYVGGTMRPGDNTTIIAKDAVITMRAGSNAVFTNPTEKVKNLKIIGGEWKSADEGGRDGTMFVFAFAENILMDGVTSSSSYDEGHTVEIIASKNVTIQNCKFDAVGKMQKGGMDEQIQIDIATKATAPKMAEYGKQYQKGQTCSNIKILNCEVTGSRAVCANWTLSEKRKWTKKFHRNIVIKGNKLIGTQAEGLAFFNVIGGEISGNEIISTAKSKGLTEYNAGLSIGTGGKAPKALKKAKLKVTNNTIRGYSYGIYATGYAKGSKIISQIGELTIANNKIYCKKGKKNAMKLLESTAKKTIIKKNKEAKWKKK